MMGLPVRAIGQLAEVSTEQVCAWGREVLRIEREALMQIEQTLGRDFDAAVCMVAHCEGSILFTGMGKAGWVARKLSATLASTGSPSHYFHPGEAFHGDLGRIRPGDCVWILSQSGETEEVVRLLPTLKEMKTPIIASTAAPQSTTGRAATIVLDLGSFSEACPHGLAPTTSTTAMMALGDAVAIAASRLKGFEAEDFAKFHPGGALGRKMAKVQDVMRPLCDCRVANELQTVREILVAHRRAGRRSGAILLCDGDGRLAGIFESRFRSGPANLRSDDAKSRDNRRQRPHAAGAGDSCRTKDQRATCDRRRWPSGGSGGRDRCRWLGAVGDGCRHLAAANSAVHSRFNHIGQSWFLNPAN
jgi:KpsF/GutQ family protein